MKYAMTVKSNSTIGFWEDCKAVTELGAKKEAWQRFGGGYVGDLIELAIKHDDGQSLPLDCASRAIIFGNRALISADINGGAVRMGEFWTGENISRKIENTC